jgi:hypothetical protein
VEGPLVQRQLNIQKCCYEREQQEKEAASH